MSLFFINKLGIWRKFLKNSQAPSWAASSQFVASTRNARKILAESLLFRQTTLKRRIRTRRWTFLVKLNSDEFRRFRNSRTLRLWPVGPWNGIEHLELKELIARVTIQDQTNMCILVSAWELLILFLVWWFFIGTFDYHTPLFSKALPII